MRFVVFGCQPNAGEKKKPDGTMMVWNKVDLQCICSDPSPVAKKKCDSGNYAQVISVKNDFDRFVITNGFQVHSFSDLRFCEIDVSIGFTGKVEAITVLSQDGITQLIN